MTDDSLTARNRINQRNFRARRQNYIKELEAKIRRYEAEGVHATIEVQTAARQVRETNEKLCTLLLKKYKMSECELINYLGPSQQSSPLFHPQSCPGSGPGSANPDAAASRESMSYDHSVPKSRDLNTGLFGRQTHASWVPIQAEINRPPHWVGLHEHPFFATPISSSPSSESFMYDLSTLDARSMSHGVGPPSDVTTDTISEPPDPTTLAERKQTDCSSDYQTGVHTLPPASAVVPTAAAEASTPRSPRPPNDESSCEEAARIIAGMRRDHADAAQVMLELGCPDTVTRCQAKNMSILELMDQA